MGNPLSIAIHLIVLNGEKYIHQCLLALQAQNDQNFQLIIFDNGSTDQTKKIINNYGPLQKNLTLIESKKNLATWGGFEESLRYSDATYSILLSVDVLLHKDFVKNSRILMNSDEQIGAVQAKVLQWHFINNAPEKTKLIDTIGFKIFRNRRLINLGQGETDFGQYDEVKEIFGVEGAVPIFRRSALENSCLPIGSNLKEGELVDHDMFWYGDDLDLVWRMRLFGWKQYYDPALIAWHDRSTTKGLKRHWYDYFFRVSARRQIPIRKRRLDWRNYRLAMVKNEYIINFLKDILWFASRELMVLGYALLFEPQIWLEIPIFFRMLPKMLCKRRLIMRRAIVSPAMIRQWFK